MPAPTLHPTFPVPAALIRGLRFSWLAFLVIVLVNTGIAAVYWIEDPRPFWHPLVTVQCYGLAIAYCVNVAAPWESPRPLLRLAVAVAIGAIGPSQRSGEGIRFGVSRSRNFALNSSWLLQRVFVACSS
jgi:hypothetical protein